MSTPNVYSTTAAINAASTGASRIDFGFDASFLRIENVAGVELHFRLDDTTATTGDFFLSTGSVFEITNQKFRMPVLNLQTTSTVAGGIATNILAAG